MVQRGIGQQQAHGRLPRRDLGRQGRAGPRRKQHDRRRRRGQQGRRGVIDLGDGAGRGQVGCHHRQGLGLALLAGSQPRHGRPVGGVDRQVITAEALDGHNPPGRQQRRRPGQRLTADRPAGGVQQAQGRPALGAGVGLGVETAVGRVLIFAPAVGAEREARHGGAGPVVGHVGDDREARAAVGAVDESVATAPVGGVEQLDAAGGASGQIRQHPGQRGAGRGAVGDPEAGLAGRRQFGAFKACEAPRRRQLGRQAGLKSRHGVGRPFDLDRHPGGVVEHKTGQAKFGGQAIDERPAADALDQAAGFEAAAARWRRGGGGRHCHRFEAPQAGIGRRVHLTSAPAESRCCAKLRWP